MQQHVNMSSRSGELSAELASQVRRARHLGVEFLQTELEMAQAFLDLAETTRDHAAALRNVRNTAKALDAVARFVQRLNPELPQRQLLSRRARQLRKQLCEVNLRRQPNSAPERRSRPDRSPVVAAREQPRRGREPLREVSSHGGGS